LTRCRSYFRADIDAIPELQWLSRDERITMKAVSAVFPFRVNDYVLKELIDWSRVPEDPIFRLVFPQPSMLDPIHLATMRDLVSRHAPEQEIDEAARRIRVRLNAHPAGQKALNIPWENGRPLPGIQHKYRETVLFFPAPGQGCHAHCMYCFRWSQFSRSDLHRFEAPESDALVRYLRSRRDVRSVLITGGDSMVMSSAVLRRYVEPLLDPSLSHVLSIRFGSKALSYWPHRFVSDPDADDLLGLFERVVEAGKHVAFMAHVSHPQELKPAVVHEAVERIRATGAVIRTQSPLVRGINDDADTWAAMWRAQIRMGMVPYYMFVVRDTGAERCFNIPLAEALAIFNGAIRQVSGLGRTVRGPVMSATPGKVLITGTGRVAGEEVFSLSFLQGRDPRWVGRPFFARFDPEATWFDQLVPAFGTSEHFFESRFREMEEGLRAGRGPEGPRGDRMLRRFPRRRWGDPAFPNPDYRA
jgi:KamA family protein